MADKTHLSIRMDEKLHDKFRYVAGAEGRSMSGQILYLMILQCILCTVYGVLQTIHNIRE